MRTVLLVWSRHRWELIALVVIVAAFVSVALWIAASFASATRDCGASDEALSPCMSQLQSLNELIPLLQAGAAGLPPLAGLLLGVGIVAREIELGTAVLAWSYAPSRVAWLLPRVAALLVPVVLLAVAMGLSMDVVYAAALPAIPVEHNLQDIQLRGLLPASRAALAFGGALLVGALVGRQLRSSVASVAICGALLAASALGTETLMRADPVVEPGVGAIITDSLFRTVDGRVLNEVQAVAELPTPDADFWAHYTPISVGIPGTRAPMVAAASVAATTAAALVLIALTAVVVERRRPY